MGKTALLEAMFLHLGVADPYLTMSLGTFRGFNPTVDAERTWAGLFRYGKNEGIIKLTSVSDENMLYETQIDLVEFNNPTQDLQMNQDLMVTRDGTAFQAPFGRIMWEKKLRFVFLIDHEEYKNAEAYFAERGPIVNGSVIKKAIIHRPVVYQPSVYQSRTNSITGYSKLMKQRKEKPILDAIRLIEPDLHDLKLTGDTGILELFADFQTGSMIPLSLAGEGLWHLFNYIVSIAAYPGGVVLFDEVENGIHYSIYGDVWRAIFNLAREQDVQVVATTHSMECLEAAHEAFLREKDLFGDKKLAIHRLEKRDDEIKAVTYDMETFSSALEMNLEIR